MMVKTMVAALLFSSVVISSSAANSGRVFSEASVHGSSAPVPVYDMVNGWGDSLRSGDYAYADARFVFGVEWKSFTLSHEKRWYYNLRFNEDTVQFYNNLDKKQLSDKLYNVYLDAQGIKADGLRLDYLYEKGRFSLKPSFVLYRIDEYQMGKVVGQVKVNGFDLSTLLASAYLNYHYDSDKILGHDDPLEFMDWEKSNPGYSYGVSTDINFKYELESWDLQLSFLDLWNSLEFEHSPYTRYCLLRGASELPSFCPNDGKDESLHEDYGASIPLTAELIVYQKDHLVQVSAYHHDRYQRFSLQKDFSTAVGLLGVSAHTTNQLGVHWSSTWHHLSVISDHFDWQQAHHLQLQFGLSIPFK